MKEKGKRNSEKKRGAQSKRGSQKKNGKDKETPATEPIYTLPTTDGRVAFLKWADVLFMRAEQIDAAFAQALTDIDGADVCMQGSVLHDLSRCPAELRKELIKEKLGEEKATLKAVRKAAPGEKKKERKKRKRLLAELKDARRKNRKHRKAAKNARAERASYSLLRRGYRQATEVHRGVLVVVSMVDVALIGLALQVLPGTDIQHWITAAGIGALLAAFGHVVGEVVAATARKLQETGLSQQMLVAVVGGLLFGTVVLGVGVISTTGFRNFGLGELAESAILDPNFLGWLQATSVFVASLSATIWRYGEDGRDLLDMEAAELAKADAAEQLVSRLLADLATSHDEEARIAREAVKAKEAERTLKERSLAQIRQEEAYAAYLWAVARSHFQSARYRVRTAREGSPSERERQRRVLIAAAVAGVLGAGIALAGGLSGLYAAAIGLIAAGVAFFLGSNREPVDASRSELDEEQVEADRPSPERVNAERARAAQNGHGDRARVPRPAKSTRARG